jgi:hypothetical protein
VTHGYCVRSTAPKEQAKEVLKQFDLNALVRPFSLCIECNGAISRADPSSVLRELGEKTKECYNEFYKCNLCGRVYWQGSHFDALKKMVQSLIFQKSHAPKSP